MIPKPNWQTSVTLELHHMISFNVYMSARAQSWVAHLASM